VITPPRVRVLVVTASILSSVTALATIRDGKPWEWEDYKAIVSHNDSHQESTCEAVEKAIGSPSLACQIDHPSWDALYTSEMKKPFTKRHDEVSPWNCQGAFTFFRPYTEGGHIPERSSVDAGPVLDELKKLKRFTCVAEATDKKYRLTYDAAKHELVFHLTLAGSNDNSWVGDELQKMKKAFPAINKYWADGHNM